MRITLLIDFGSTYTKVVAVDLEKDEVLAVEQSVSTVATDITIGLQSALGKLVIKGEPVANLEIERKMACSSAAGGLRLVAIGLVPALTVEAARRAAFGAGAKVVGTYSYELSEPDMRQIEGQPCDLILLAGGIDGGNKSVIQHNATVLARSTVTAPIVVAGNRAVSEKVRSTLESAGKYVEVAENVLPELDKLNVESAQSHIREIFMRRITKAKGLDKAREYVGDIIMPTPMAVLKAARLLSEGTDEEPGMGELMVIDVGGATTNVHSVAPGYPTRPAVIMKGLPEPYAKRTVEGDLGIRYNAATILSLVGERKILENMPPSHSTGKQVDLKKATEKLSQNIGFVPQKEADFLVDVALARTAAGIATERHVGVLQEVPTLEGIAYIQYGKDLTMIRTLVGTGGVLARGWTPEHILAAALFDDTKPLWLKPQAPDCYIDRRYILFAVGLLSEVAPTQALRIAKKNLKRLSGKATSMAG